ncbi:hypothetical protein TNCT_710371 [Trichonephila clavata]|uniref:Uncharacterized protein n=1 Tax=Trichonephila clavata TaxID=2740835 RepID=A0A8X6L8Q7_TRICU|nr:hypothetical protein TNCT_710371 [Trichonephila clavata]
MGSREKGGRKNFTPYYDGAEDRWVGKKDKKRVRDNGLRHPYLKRVLRMRYENLKYCEFTKYTYTLGQWSCGAMGSREKGGRNFLPVGLDRVDPAPPLPFELQEVESPTD